MGIDLNYIMEGREFSRRLSIADWQTVDELRKHLPDEVSVAFDVDELGESVEVETGRLRDAVEAIDRLLKERPELLPYTYQFKEEYYFLGPPENRRKHYSDRFDTGGQGVRLPGDEGNYFIWAGLNQLWLEKLEAGPNGEMIRERRDLRGETELQTDSAGLVKFRKRRAKTSIRKLLAEVQNFLASVESATVTKIVG